MRVEQYFSNFARELIEDMPNHLDSELKTFTAAHPLLAKANHLAPTHL